MKTIDVSLLGRTYQVACAAGQEKRLQHLAHMFEEKMKLAASSGQGSVGEIRLLLLGGLMLADDVLEARAAAENAVSSIREQAAVDEDMMVSAVDYLAGRINALTNRIEQAH